MMVDQRLQCCDKPLLIQVGRNRQQHRLAEVLERYTALQQPSNNWRGSDRTYSVVGTCDRRRRLYARDRSEFLDSLMLEDIAGCEEQASAAGAAHQLNGQDAVAPEGEEVIMDADARQAQDLGKQ